MSTCISRQGEFSEHEIATEGPHDERYVCSRCFVFDEAAALAALEALQEAVDRVRELAKCQAVACQAAHRADHARNWLDVLALLDGSAA